MSFATAFVHLNLPGFSSFAQADQLSSSCLQLLPKVAEDQPGLGQHSTVVVPPIPCVWGLLEDSLTSCPGVAEKCPWQPQKQALFYIIRGCGFRVFSFFFFFFFFTSLEDLQ